MRPLSPALLERLSDLALVEVNVLTARVPAEELQPLLSAFVADVTSALDEARLFLRDGHRELATGPDPLALLDLPSERRAGIGEGGLAEASIRLAQRAAGRRELARLEELVRDVLPRLLEADRLMGGM